MPSIIYTSLRFLPWALAVILLGLNIQIFMFPSTSTLNDNGVWVGSPLPGRPLALAEQGKKKESDKLPKKLEASSGKSASTQKKVKSAKSFSSTPIDKASSANSSDKLTSSKAVSSSEKITFFVQVGSFVLDLGVDSLMDRLRAKGMEPHLKTVREQVRLNNVQAGPFPNLEEAKEAETILKAAGMAIQVEETWEGFIISLGQHPLLGYAIQKMESARNLGVKTLRVVKIEVDRPVKKVLIGPYINKDDARRISAKVAKLGLAIPVIQELVSSK